MQPTTARHHHRLALVGHDLNTIPAPPTIPRPIYPYMGNVMYDAAAGGTPPLEILRRQPYFMQTDRLRQILPRLPKASPRFNHPAHMEPWQDLPQAVSL